MTNQHNNSPTITSRPNTHRPGAVHAEERGTTYLAPPVRQKSSDVPVPLQSNYPRNNNSNSHFYPPTMHRQDSDPPARHIREERAANDEPSSFYANSHGVLQAAPRRPVLAAAQIVEDESSRFHHTTPPTIEEDGESYMSMDSIGDAWQRRGGFRGHGAAGQRSPGEPIVATVVEASAFNQDDPSLMEVSQSNVLSAGERYAPHQLSRRRQFAVRPVSGLTQASVLSERTWATHDQFRSGLALADPIYEGGEEDEDAPVLAAMEQFSLSQGKLQAEEAAAQAARDQAAADAPKSQGFLYSTLPRLAGRTQSSQSSAPTPPPSAPANRASSDPFPPKGGGSVSSGTSGIKGGGGRGPTGSNGSVVSSVVSSGTSGTANSTDSADRVGRAKKLRVRAQRGAAVGGMVVGGLTLGPIGAVAGAAGGYAVTRLAGRHRERKMREQLERDEEGDCVADDDGSTQDETQSESQAYEIPLNNIFYTPRHDHREDDLEETVSSRFKAEARQHGRRHLEA